MSGKQNQYWPSICGQRQAKGFLSLKKKAGEATGCQLKGYLFKLELVKSPRCDQCKQASGMVLNETRRL
jgi:hypothetical protein